MNHATTAQPTPSGMMSAAEGAELRRQIADLTRGLADVSSKLVEMSNRMADLMRDQSDTKSDVAGVKAGKMDTNWGVKMGGGLFAITFGLLLLIMIDNRDRIIRLEGAVTHIAEQLDEIEKLLRGEEPSLPSEVGQLKPSEVGGNVLGTQPQSLTSTGEIA